ncbi:helix-turn-helix domain-containing protein [Streptomyces sp.]|uniref:helix-turn-helix domain-containing protein n=1 Tax=Streptomyces sp. TaxID=1931 RepID=UPI002F948CC6
MTSRHPVVALLVDRREELGWTQFDLACASGKSVSAINHFENDSGGRRWDLVEEIAEALGLYVEFRTYGTPTLPLREAS